MENPNQAVPIETIAMINLQKDIQIADLFKQIESLQQAIKKFEPKPKPSAVQAETQV